MAASSPSVPLGNTIFQVLDVAVHFSQPWFVPASSLNALRRQAVEALEAARARAYNRPARAIPIQPPAPFPEDTLSYLGNVFNQAAHRFYAKHGVKVIAPAYEAIEELGEVSLMVTKHCVRFSLSLCPKQAKGVTGVQGQVKAAVVRQSREELLQAATAQPLQFHKRRPPSSGFGH